jgi:hypothetical protein
MTQRPPRPRWAQAKREARGTFQRGPPSFATAQKSDAMPDAKSAKNQEKTTPIGSFSMLALFRGIEAEAGGEIRAALREVLGEEALERGLAALARAQDAALAAEEKARAQSEELRGQLAALTAPLSERERLFVARGGSKQARAALGLPPAAPKEIAGKILEKAADGLSAQNTQKISEASTLFARFDHLEAMLSERASTGALAALSLGALAPAELADASAVLAAVPAAIRRSNAAEAISQASFCELGGELALRPAQGAAAAVDREAGAKGLALRTGPALGVLEAEEPQARAEREQERRWGFSPSADDEAGSFLSGESFAPSSVSPKGEAVDGSAMRSGLERAIAIALGVRPAMAAHWGAMTQKPIAESDASDETEARRAERALAEGPERLWAELLEQALGGILSRKEADSAMLSMVRAMHDGPRLEREELGDFAQEAAEREAASRAERGSRKNALAWAADWQSVKNGDVPLGVAGSEVGRESLGDAGAQIAKLASRSWRFSHSSFLAAGLEKRKNEELAKKQANEPLAAPALTPEARDAFAGSRAAIEKAHESLQAVEAIAKGASAASSWATELSNAKSDGLRIANQRALAWERAALGPTRAAQEAIFGVLATTRQTAWCARNPEALLEAIESGGAHGRAAARWGARLGIDPAQANGGNHLCSIAREAWIAKGGSTASWKLIASLPEGALARLDRTAWHESAEAFAMSVAALDAAAEAGQSPASASRWMHALVDEPSADAPTGHSLHKNAPNKHLATLNAIAPDSVRRSMSILDIGAFDLGSESKRPEADWQARHLSRAAKLAETLAKRREPEPGRLLTLDLAKAIEEDFIQMRKRASRVLRAALSRAEAVDAFSGSNPREEDLPFLAHELMHELMARRFRQAGMPAAAVAVEPEKTPEETAREEAAKRLATKRRAAIQRFERELGEVGDWLARSEIGVWATLPMKPEWPLLARRAHEWHELVEARQNAAHDAKQWDPLFGAQTDGDFKAVELVTGRQLREEGRAMHHCVSTYAGDCVKGKSRIFSIQLDGERHSTLELGFNEATGRWTADQNLGVCNSREIDPKATELGRKLAAKATELGLKPTRQASAEEIAQEREEAAQAAERDREFAERIAQFGGLPNRELAAPEAPARALPGGVVVAAPPGEDAPFQGLLGLRGGRRPALGVRAVIDRIHAMRQRQEGPADAADAQNQPGDGPGAGAAGGAGQGNAGPGNGR